MIKNKKNLLILGGLGFIGKNLIDELLDPGDYNLIIFDYNCNLPEEWPKDSVKMYQGNFRSKIDLEKVFQENKIDTVFHLISTTIPSTSNDDILNDIDSNLNSTIFLLDLMKKYKSSKIVFASSGGTVYGLLENENINSFSENYQNNPICSHGIVKLAVEKYLYLYKYLYNIDYLILRIANPFGEGHSSQSQGLINVVISNFVNKKNIIVWGDGKIVRDYIYVKDVAKIIKNIFEKKITNQIINIGSGVGHSVNDIINMIQKVTGKFDVKKAENRKLDVPYSVLDVSKMKSIIDFKLTDIREGIKNTYNYILSQKHE